MIINPAIYEKNKVKDAFSMSLENRVIYLIGEVTDEMAAMVVAQLLVLDSGKDACEGKGKDSTIYLYINSPGGCVNAGLAIYDTIKHMKCDVSTICMGYAASMGAVILSGGTKGKRCILPHSEVMIHQPSSGFQGQASDIEIAAEHIKDLKGVLYEILSENCDKDIKVIEADCDRDHWMKAEEAKEYGIVDNIL